MMKAAVFCRWMCVMDVWEVRCGGTGVFSPKDISFQYPRGRYIVLSWPLFFFTSPTHCMHSLSLAGALPRMHLSFPLNPPPSVSIQPTLKTINMSSMNFSSSKQNIKPPQRGIFPLDHDSECKPHMQVRWLKKTTIRRLLSTDFAIQFC